MKKIAYIEVRSGSRIVEFCAGIVPGNQGRKTTLIRYYEGTERPQGARAFFVQIPKGLENELEEFSDKVPLPSSRRARTKIKKLTQQAVK